ncbi:hypothetical protein C8035_v002764 [Colletotrichum spinosum]|uniref:Uncharacterized protein n=1 Tax=Colletotrichum spinosum TaxID=1347390 RepID=A0A4R8Q9J4_9PEZI|nr:hypothetical protein C8035_v002764 [Colletotrichum spinosum]
MHSLRNPSLERGRRHPCHSAQLRNPRQNMVLHDLARNRHHLRDPGLLGTHEAGRKPMESECIRPAISHTFPRSHARRSRRFRDFQHIVIWYGHRWSVLRPSLYPWVFMGTDFLSIFIQIVGGGWTAASAAGGGNETMAKFGEKLVIGGVATQVVNIAMCRGRMSAYTA